jgi:hypothetical protein
MSSVRARIEKLERSSERVAKAREQRQIARSGLDPRCICYPPQKNQPMVGFAILVGIAFIVKCPLHGNRFPLRLEPFNVYMAKWLRKKLYDLVAQRCSWIPQECVEQYCKAYFASFPPDLWPGEEEKEREERAEGDLFRTYLRLKDGTRLQVNQYCFAKPNGNQGDRKGLRNPEPKEKRAWQVETLRTVGRLLADRGRMVDPRFL